MNLITSHDEHERCCVLDDDGNQCTNPADFWVGANGIDDYTHVCAGHLGVVKRDGDAVLRLRRTLEASSVFRLLHCTGKHELQELISWDKYAEFCVPCNDAFAWGTADAVDFTPDNIGIFEQAVLDCIAAAPDDCTAALRGPLLFCARVRQMRPQGCVYPDDARWLWPLLDACGPEREIGHDNPYRPGERKR